MANVGEHCSASCRVEGEKLAPGAKNALQIGAMGVREGEREVSLQFPTKGVSSGQLR